MKALILAFLLASAPGETVPFVAICITPDPLAKMSTVQQEQGMLAGSPLWREALAVGDCIQLPQPVNGTFGGALGVLARHL